MRDAVVKSTVAVNDVFHHPRGGRPANNEHEVVLKRSPTVPKIPQRVGEIRLARVEAGEFVDEHDAAFVFGHLSHQEMAQHLEGLIPILGLSLDGVAIQVHRIDESVYLCVFVSFQDTCHGKGEPFSESAVYQEGFPHTTATVKGYELRFPRLGVSFQEFGFFFATDDSVHGK